jgi:predicted enzyme related to lactoylglutathione lyase
MAEFTSHPAGAPCWVDLASPDLAASKAFYGTLFGWAAETSPDPAAGGYTMFTLRGKQVAGLGPIMGEGQPSAWSTYIAVDDADKTTEAVLGAGGQVIVPPMDVLDAGRMAVFLDNAGAAISIWQPGTTIGAQLANEPGAFAWNELNTRDVAAGSAFYPAVFGWSVRKSDENTGMEYFEFQRDGASIAGMMPMPEQVPAEVPPHWVTYFAVTDADAAVATTQKLGGALLVGPIDLPFGRFAVLSGPHREVFAVIKM